MVADDSFLSRWSRRKALAREGVAPPAEPVAAPAAPAVTAGVVEKAPALEPLPPDDPPAPVATAEPPPTMEDVARLDRESSFARFVKPDVAPDVKSAALKKLFSDPHFNVMDGLDIYIDDYGKPDPMPASMLRQLASAHALGLFRDDSPPQPAAAGAPAEAPPATTEAVPDPADDTAACEATAPDAADDALPPPEPADENADLRLQPNDAAGCAGAEPGAGEDAGRQH